jgi:hypothetical protein
LIKEEQVSLAGDIKNPEEKATRFEKNRNPTL